MNIYYETAHYEPGDEFPTATAHDTLEEAIEFAEAHGINYISEHGGNYDDFVKCEFCGEWFTSEELNDKDICSYCEQAIKSHGG